MAMYQPTRSSTTEEGWDRTYQTAPLFPLDLPIPNAVKTVSAASWIAKKLVTGASMERKLSRNSAMSSNDPHLESGGRESQGAATPARDTQTFSSMIEYASAPEASEMLRSRAVRASISAVT